MYGTRWSGIKQYIIYIIIGILTVALMGTIAVSMNISKRQKKEIKALNAQITALQDDMIGVYAVGSDVKAGETIEVDSLTQTSVPKDAVPPNAISSLDDVSGCMYKIALKAGTYLTKDMLMTEKISNNHRELDIVMDEIPIGLEEGDYIDVRIAFANGLDYIGMSHKKVVGINRNTVKIVVYEHDIYRYQSMQQDIAKYRETKLYATKYIEAGIQKKAKNYYPPTLKIIRQAMHDPNMNRMNFKALLDSREMLEKTLAKDKTVEKNDTVNDGKNSIHQEFQSAREEYNQLAREREASEE
ncbi:SAF domain-containing protein [Lachnospiraceae bacterium KHCPX20]|nr:SAF domain-containing protein [Lachnospiraceae bacterium KHCPX20]